MNVPFSIIQEQLQPRFQECIYWMKSAIWRHLLDPFIFSIIVLSFHGSNWSQSYVKDIVSISQHLLQPSILVQAVCGWFEKNWMICLFEESYCSPALLLRCLFIPQNYLQWYLFEKCCAKCTKELVATPLFVGECVNLQFHNSNCSYSLSVVNFSEEHLQTFAFARVTFGTTTFSKELLFQNNYSLILFCGTVVFGNSYC